MSVPKNRSVPSITSTLSNPARSAILDLVGNTPLVEVTRLDTGLCQLFLKMEAQNPGGSIKDRVAVSMIEAAEREGKLQDGGTVIEATAGNTGLGLALVARAKGYRVILVVPDKMSIEKIRHLKALGAEVHLTRSDVGKGHPEYYQDYAARITRETPGAFFADQFNNPNNPLAHERTTGPEIWEQMEHHVDAIVCGVGSSGTITGLTRFFRTVHPEIEFVLADPEGSILVEYVKTGKVAQTSGSWAVEGIGEDFIPAIADFSRVTAAYSIPDEESFRLARDLVREEAILGGSSTGTLLAAALRYCRAQTTPKRVVSFVCDTGTRYLSKVYNENWLLDQGLLKHEEFGDLRDIIGRRFGDGGVVSVSPTDTLLTAFNRMRGAEVSQLPVIEGDRIIGIMDESDLLMRVAEDAGHFDLPVESAMTRTIETLPPSASLTDLRTILERGLVAIIADGQTFYGLITRSDLLNHLRKTLSHPAVG
jgi:cystathionine beta-synthase